MIDVKLTTRVRESRCWEGAVQVSQACVGKGASEGSRSDAARAPAQDPVKFKLEINSKLYRL